MAKPEGAFTKGVSILHFLHFCLAEILPPRIRCPSGEWTARHAKIEISWTIYCVMIGSDPREDKSLPDLDWSDFLNTRKTHDTDVKFIVLLPRR